MVGELQGEGLLCGAVHLVVRDGYANGAGAPVCRDGEYLVGLAGVYLPGVVGPGCGGAVHGGIPYHDGSRSQNWPDGYGELNVAVGLRGPRVLQVYICLRGVFDGRQYLQNPHTVVVAARNGMDDGGVSICADFPVIRGRYRNGLWGVPVGCGERESVGYDPEQSITTAGQVNGHCVSGPGVQDQGVGQRLTAFLQGKSCFAPGYAAGVVVSDGEGCGPDGQSVFGRAGGHLRALQDDRLGLLVHVVVCRLEPQRGCAAGLARGDDNVEGLDILERALRVHHLEAFDVGLCGGAVGAVEFHPYGGIDISRVCWAKGGVGSVRGPADVREGRCNRNVVLA